MTNMDQAKILEDTEAALRKAQEKITRLEAELEGEQNAHKLWRSYADLLEQVVRSSEPSEGLPVLYLQGLRGDAHDHKRRGG